MKYYTSKILWLLILVLMFSNCEKEENEQDDISEINLTGEYVYLIMKDFYLWNEYLPSNPYINKSPYDLLEDLRYSSVDKWSFIISTEEYKAIFEEGEYKGYGFSYTVDDSNKIRITYVFKDSPLKEYNIDRSWIITHIDGTELTSDTDIGTLLNASDSHSFTFKDTNGNELTQTFTKKTVTINTVLFDTIFNVNDLKIGYFVFESFIEPSKDELNSLFAKYQTAGIDELIVDLRYNGGGRSDIGLQLGGLIGGSKVEDKIMTKFIYNDNLQDENQDLMFKSNENSIDIERVFFITTRGSASASEMVINGLSPFMDVYLVGDDTHGKPVGMNVWPFKDLTFAPVTFRITNTNDEGDYFEGIPADSYVDDDVYHKFGDTTELCLKEVLHYINEGSFTVKSSVKSMGKKELKPKYGIRQFFDAY